MTEGDELSAPALLVYLASGTAMLGAAAMSPVLPAIQSTFGVSDAQIGLVMSVFTFSVAVTVPVLGWLADRVGRRPVLGGSLLLFGVAGIATYFAPDFQVLLALRAFQGVGFGGTIPLVVAIISDMFDGSTEVGAQGFRVTAVNLGGFLFPVATGAVVAIAWNVPFLLFALAIPVGAAVLYWLPEPTESVQRPDGNYLRAVLLAARRPLVAIAVAVGTLRFFTLYALYAYLPLLIVARDLGAGQVGIVIGAISAVKMVVATQTSRSVAISPPRVTFVVALLVSLLVVGAFAAATSFLAFVVVAGALGAVEGVSAPMQKTVLTRYAPPNVRGGIVSLNAAAQNLGKTVGPIALGAAVVMLDTPTAFLALGAGGTVLAVALLVAVLVVGEQERPGPA
jgi:predicted MFS family arabinose efflux permease